MNKFLRCLLCVLLFGVVSCASSAESKKETEETSTAGGPKTESGLGEALMTPLSDLNLYRREIPAPLLALSSTYDPIEDSSCEGIAKLVAELDLILGMDDDNPISEGGGNAAAAATLNLISGQAGGLIPFRGIVRRATGASKREERIIAAFQRGLTRRAYLKGIGSQKACVPPASPRSLSFP